MSDTFESGVALVTGAGSGIGRAAAVAFANRGCAVVVSDIEAAAGESTVRSIADAGGRAQFVACDVADDAGVERLIAETVERFGRLDFAHNNAGIDGDTTRRLAEQAPEDWERVLAVDLSGVFHCLRHELAVMAEQRSGSIVNTASLAGLRGFAKAAPYVAAKHGVVGLTRTAALDYAAVGVRVNAVCPGVIETGMVAAALQDNPKMIDGLVGGTPMRRLGTPEEVAATVLWLCSDEAAYVTGQAIAVDGGFSA